MNKRNFKILKPKERSVLNYIQEYFDMYQMTPTLSEIQEALDLGSRTIAHYYVRNLEKGGFVELENSDARNIKLLAVD